MKAEVFAIGTEILIGDILDTNSHFIARRLPALGIDCYFTHQVGDNLERLTGELRRAWERSDLLLLTGGLGPTEDDVTREAVAALVDEQPVVDPELEHTLRGFFAGRGYAMPERNVKQAWLLPSTRAIPNPRGTAPGWWVEKDGRVLVAMPGPPAEFTFMWEQEVEPRLARLAGGAVIVSRTLKTIGVGEGTVDEMLSPLLKSTNPTIGVYAKQDGVHARITAKAATRDDATALIAPLEAEVRRILGTAVWGADDDTLGKAVGEMLRDRGMTLATMESCTAGLLGATITETPRSSDYYRGGFISYWTELKKRWGVPAQVVEQHGVVSAECAEAMARAAALATDADFGLSVTCVAGLDPQEEKPPGTVHVGCYDRATDRASHISFRFNQGRHAVRERAVTVGLLLLRRTLLGEQPGQVIRSG